MQKLKIRTVGEKDLMCILRFQKRKIPQSSRNFKSVEKAQMVINLNLAEEKANLW